jgi:hypothetical protein
MHSTLHLPASEAYKMVGLRDTGPTDRPPSNPQPAAAAEPARRPAEAAVLRRLTGHTVA